MMPKVLEKLRDMKLDSKMVKICELTRTLIYVSNRLKKSGDDEKEKVYKMSNFLYKV